MTATSQTDRSPPSPAPSDPFSAMQTVRKRQVILGLGLLATGLQLVVAQGAVLGLRPSLLLMAVCLLGMAWNWRCPRCRGYLWLQTSRATASAPRRRVRCLGCGLDFG